MHSCAELALKDPNPALPDWLKAQVSALQSQLAERDAELKRRELKIQQLTLELAHHKRIRFGCKSEVFSPEQRDLFVDACDEDGAAIVAELAQATSGVPRPHKRTGRNRLPPELPRIEHRHALRAGRSPSRRDPEFAGHGKAQWLGAVRLAQGDPRKTPHLAM